MPQPSYQGRFIWQELHSDDPEAAAAFYTSVMSWKARPFSPGSPYTLFVGAAGAPVAGVVRLSDESRAMGAVPHWLGYIGTADVDATVAHAARLGARALKPAEDMPGVGRAAVLADPQGAVFAVFQPLQGDGSSPRPESGYSWFELAARERETALEFYRALFGWELRPPMDMGDGFYYQTFGLGAQDFGGAYTIAAERPMPPSWLPYGHHRSADEAAQLAVAAGAKVCHGPVDVPGGGRIVQLFDPQGVIFAIHSPPTAMKAAAPAAQPKKAPPKKPAAPAKQPAQAKKKPAAAKPARNPTRRTARRTVKKPATPRAKQAARAAAGKTVRKVAKKAARKVSRKVARKVTKKSARKPAGRKLARQASRKPARKSARRPARKK